MLKFQRFFRRFSLHFPRCPSPNLKKIQALVKFYQFLIILLGCTAIGGDGISGNFPENVPEIFRICSGKKSVKNPDTPQQYNKKPVKFDQGLDFLKVWRGKSRKTIGKTRENEEKTVKSKNFRALFSY